MKTKADKQLCWDCKNACGNGCCWFQDGVPIKGWKAKATQIKSSGENGKPRMIDSFCIQKCPQYIQDGDDRKLSSKELANILNLSQRSIFRLKKENKIKLVNGEYLFNGKPIIRRKNVR